MALQSGLDLVAIVSQGVYSETYGAGSGGNIAILFASRGYLEGAPPPSDGAFGSFWRLILGLL
jgi:hypothetical protein